MPSAGSAVKDAITLADRRGNGEYSDRFSPRKNNKPAKRGWTRRAAGIILVTPGPAQRGLTAGAAIERRYLSPPMRSSSGFGT